MVDVVNSSLVNATVLRNGGDTSGAQQQSIIDDAVASGAPETPKAPYVSPYISINFDYDRAVLQIRDADTGDVQEQFPTNSRLAQDRRAQTQLERASTVENAGLNFSEQATQSQQSSGGQSQIAQDVITVQDVSSAVPANSSPQFSPQIAVQALSVAAQSGVSSSISAVNVQA